MVHWIKGKLSEYHRYSNAAKVVFSFIKRLIVVKKSTADGNFLLFHHRKWTTLRSSELAYGRLSMYPQDLLQGWRPSLLMSTVNRLDSATFGGYAFAVWKHFRRCISIRYGEKITTRPVRSNLPAIAVRSTGICRSLYRQLPFALPAIAIRPTGNCHSPYRHMPFALPAIAIRSTGNCHSLTNQGTLDNFLPFPVWAYHINGSSSGSIVKRNTAIREKMD